MRRESSQNVGTDAAPVNDTSPNRRAYSRRPVSSREEATPGEGLSLIITDADGRGKQKAGGSRREEGSILGGLGGLLDGDNR